MDRIHNSEKGEKSDSLSDCVWAVGSDRMDHGDSLNGPAEWVRANGRPPRRRLPAVTKNRGGVRLLPPPPVEKSPPVAMELAWMRS